MELECQERAEVAIVGEGLSNQGAELRIGDGSVEVPCVKLCYQQKKSTLVVPRDKDLSTNTHRYTIIDLPQALISEILNCLDPKELGLVSCVSTCLHRLASEHHAWKGFYCERWGLPVVLGGKTSEERSWKELGSWDMSVRIWDRSSFKCIKTLRHSDWVWGLAPHETSIACAAGSDVYIWDISSETPEAIIHDAHEGNTYSLARSHSGDFLFTGGEDGGIKMFEIRKHGNETSVLLISQWMPHTGPVYSLSFEFPWLVSASGDGKLALIDVRKLLKTNRRGLPK
ncbi:hypothetical protein IGI04_041087, partial [Brassica rapa subsp. trilocularis]